MKLIERKQYLEKMINVTVAIPIKHAWKIFKRYTIFSRFKN